MGIFNSWWVVLHDGVHHIAPNQGVILGIVIGLVFGWMAGSIVSVLIGALGASIAFIAVDTLWPVIFSHQPFVMPTFNGPFWHFLLALYGAFLLIIGVVFLIKLLVSNIRG
jgi:uncharacterized membrane protein